MGENVNRHHDFVNRYHFEFFNLRLTFRLVTQSLCTKEANCYLFQSIEIIPPSFQSLPGKWFLVQGDSEPETRM
jgi:hypothetical protein